MELVFRKVDETDAADVRGFNELMDDLSMRAYDESLLVQKIRNMNAREDAWLMVAEDKATGRLCGSLIAVLFDDFCGDCSPVMVIENVVTHHEYRRMGVGRALFEEVERWGREKKASYAILCSAMSRHEAHRFYSAIGYEDVRGFKKHF